MRRREPKPFSSAGMVEALMPVFLGIDDGVSSGSACRLTERNSRERLAGIVDDPKGGQVILPGPGGANPARGRWRGAGPGGSGGPGRPRPADGRLTPGSNSSLLKLAAVAFQPQ